MKVEERVDKRLYEVGYCCNIYEDLTYLFQTGHFD